MPRQRGIGGVTCSDCYFRQELLCALKTERVCPTFRATVGRTPARPQQAQLIPVPTLAQVQRAVDTPGDLIPRPAAADVVARIPVDDESEPFTSASPEANFSLRDVEGADESVVPAREAVADQQPRMREAAAAIEPRAAVEIAVDAQLDTSRSSRIAQRIAARYPGALQLC